MRSLVESTYSLATMDVGYKNRIDVRFISFFFVACTSSIASDACHNVCLENTTRYLGSSRNVFGAAFSPYSCIQLFEGEILVEIESSKMKVFGRINEAKFPRLDTTS